MNSDDTLFQKWADWMPTILEDVTGTLLNRHVFREVQAIVKANPRIQMASVFYEWMTVQYGATAAIGIRRQVDMHPDSISLARLLTEIKENPSVLSRERFLRFFSKYKHPEVIGNNGFDQHVGEGRAHVDPAAVEAELNDLKTRATRVRTYTNKRIAHYDRSTLTSLPTVADLDACIEYMEYLVKRYTVLLRGESYDHLLPTFVYDWKEVFRYPWVVPAESDEEE